MVNTSEMKAARVKAGFTQAQIAEILNISTPAYNRYENGKSPIDIDKALRFCEACEVTDANQRAIIFLL